MFSSEVRNQLSDRGLVHAQLLENAKTARASIIGNIINVVACGALLLSFDALSATAQLMGALMLFAIIFWRLKTARAVLASTPDVLQLIVWRRHVFIMATLLGSFWGLITGYILSADIHEMEIVGGIIGAGMMSAGAIAFRTLRKAAFSYVFCCAIGGVVGLLSIGEVGAMVGIVLTGCYLMVLCSNIRATSDRFDRAYWREEKLAEAADTIQLLLTDLTEQGTEMLLEVDPQGRIQNPCEKMSDLFEMHVAQLSGTKFGRLLDSGAEATRLRTEFAEGRIIRRHQLTLTVNGKRKWISVSARPKAGGSRGYRGVITDLTAQRTAEERVTFLAHYDALTSLPNRMLFNDNVTRAAKRHDGRIAIMYLDLDNFKAVNDTLGHPVGDRVLVEVARRIEAAISQQDVASRFGGDEFVVLVAGSRTEKVDHLALRIVKDLAKPFVIDGMSLDIGGSIGIAIGPEHGETGECLIRRADLALYSAKSQGRGCAVRFEPTMDEAAQARRSVETDLRKALRNGEMKLHYQPLIDVGSKNVSGFEALLRWEHPVQGMIMPNSFIPVAEDTGLIQPLGDWVIRQALMDAAQWPDDVSIAINLSPVQFRSNGLIGTLMQALANSGVAPHRVCLEITESVFLQDSDANIDMLHRIHDLGVQISLDDFGTGYSSLNYLRSFPFSKIKIDRCFIADIENSTDCQAIVRSVISLADSLGMGTIAEGIERESQAAVLRQEGCSELQGFLYSKAVPANEVAVQFKDRPEGADHLQFG